MDFKNYVPRATGGTFGKVRHNQLLFLEAIETLQGKVAKLEAENKALKGTEKITKEVK